MKFFKLLLIITFLPILVVLALPLVVLGKILGDLMERLMR